MTPWWGAVLLTLGVVSGAFVAGSFAAAGAVLMLRLLGVLR